MAGLLTEVDQDEADLPGEVGLQGVEDLAEVAVTGPDKVAGEDRPTA